MSLFQLGDFALSSGAMSKWKIDCDALTDSDISTLAALIRQLVGSFSSVEGIPIGGLRLAVALKQFACLTGPHLIVDDVLTTGETMEAAADKYLHNNWSTGKVIGAVVFARGQHAHWIRPLFSMPECFWPAPLHR